MHKKVLFSFKYAFEGIWLALHTEHNLLIQLLLGILGTIMGIYFQITQIEWLIGITVFALDFSLELTNTAIEEVVDSFTDQVHPSAKKAKDVAAAAVMTAFIAEVVVGLLIFLPYILKFLTV